MVLKTIGRLILIPIAFVLAAAAALFVLFTLGLERLTHAFHENNSEDLIANAFDFMWQGSLVLSGVTILPALAVVIIGEVARIRSWIYYMVGGGAAMAAMPLIARVHSVGTADLESAILWQVFATAGFAGGLVYWLFAGRGA